MRFTMIKAIKYRGLRFSLWKKNNAMKEGHLDTFHKRILGGSIPPIANRGA